MIDWTVVHIRKEMEVIPDGISLTETEIANYIYIRRGDTKIAVRIPKHSDDEMTAYKESQLPEKKWNLIPARRY